MATNTKVKMRLQGHEKFPLREGWLNKGLRIVNDNPMVFQGKEGPDEFGIGNNMVKSLRYWLKAFDLIEGTLTKGLTLTEFGKTIYEYDPYIEQDFTLWILHSKIAKNIEEATSWYMFFNRCDLEDMEKDIIEKVLHREIVKYASGQTFSEKSVKNDLDVILNMYSKGKKVEDPEEKSVSPFVSLNLIKNCEGSYSKKAPDRRKINEDVILFELADLMNGLDNISIEHAINGECGISKIYQLKSVDINEMLDRLDSRGYIRVDRTAGLDIIYREKDFSQLDVMKEYYIKRG